MHPTNQMSMWGVVDGKNEKGFGFIVPEGGFKGVFFHRSSLVDIPFDLLEVGQYVAFEVEQSSGRPIAVSVRRDDHTTEGVQQIIGQGKIEVVRHVTDALLRALVAHPDELRNLHPQLFEEVIAKVLEDEGCKCEMVGHWNQADGGVDIIAVHRDQGGFELRYAVQCKRYSEHRLITAAPIRELAGVLDRFRAHAGVLATTSHFTNHAKNEAATHLWKIGLRDYENILASLQRLRLFGS